MHYETIAEVISVFTERLVALVMDPDGEPGRIPPFSQLVEHYARVCGGSSPKTCAKTQTLLTNYVHTIQTMWNTSPPPHQHWYVAAHNCMAAGEALGYWLDHLINAK